MILLILIVAAIAITVVGNVTKNEAWYNIAQPLYLASFVFFVVTVFTSFLYVSTETHPASHIQIVGDKLYYTETDGSYTGIKLNSVSFAPNTLSPGEGVAIKTCTANPIWLSLPLTNCGWKVYTDDVSIGQEIKD